MEIQLEKFSYPKDLAEQRKLFIECFPENIGTIVETEEHYKWKFKSFPTKDKEKAYEYVARLNGEMIGYYAAIPYQYYIQDKTVYAAMVCDVMTGVKARGKGVFTKLGLYSTNQFKKEGLFFSTGYPIRPEVIPGHKKAGWVFPFQIPMYGKFLKFNAFLKTRKKSFLTPFANLGITIYNDFLKLFSGSSNEILVERYDSSQVDSIAGISEFTNKWRNENPIALNKNTHFLKWRLGAPDKNYEIIVLRSKTNKNVLAYSIARELQKEDVPCYGVLDFSFINESKKHSKQLLTEIEKSARQNKAELILMMMMRYKAKSYRLKSAGFMKTPFPFSFIINQFEDTLDAEFLKNEKNWNLMWIDSDDL